MSSLYDVSLGNAELGRAGIVAEEGEVEPAVVIAQEHIRATVPAVGDMVGKHHRDNSGQSWQRVITVNLGPGRKRTVSCPRNSPRNKRLVPDPPIHVSGQRVATACPTPGTAPERKITLPSPPTSSASGLSTSPSAKALNLTGMPAGRTPEVEVSMPSEFLVTFAVAVVTVFRAIFEGSARPAY